LGSKPAVDIIELHAKLFKKHGATTIRNFDALNDVNNLIYAGQMIQKHGLKPRFALRSWHCHRDVPARTDAAFYLKTLDEIMASGVGFDSLCFKDASGTATPAVSTRPSRKRARTGQKVHICLHTHESREFRAAYKAALDAGRTESTCDGAHVRRQQSADIVTMWHALRGTDYTLDIDSTRYWKPRRYSMIAWTSTRCSPRPAWWSR